jgi:threonylcarbamoyladenosine tRNA methylthiotransferase CDKAL1
MKRIPTNVVKQRSREATKLFNSYTSFDHLLGTVQDVLVTEVSSDGKNYIAHNKNFTQILIETDSRLMGKQIKVKIIETSKWHLIGKVLPESMALLETGTVEPSRIPQLIRFNKQLVSLKSNQDKSNDQRVDGSILSIQKTRLIPEKLKENKIGSIAPIALALTLSGIFLYKKFKE